MKALPEEDRQWYRENARNKRDAELCVALEEGCAMAEAGRRAGFSGGKSRDAEKRRQHFAAAASRAASSRRIQRLREQYRLWKTSEDSPVAGTDETMKRLSEIVRTGTDTAAIQAAAKLLDAHRRSPAQQNVGLDKVRMLIDRCCAFDELLLQIAGLEYARLYRGLPCMADWTPPEHLQRVDRYLDRLRPLDVLALLEGR